MLASLLEEAPRFFTYYNIVFIGEALLQTLALSFLGAAVGFVIGFGLAVLRTPRVVDFLPARVLAIAFVEVFRRIPFLVKLMCVFFAFQLSGAKVSMFTVALVTVTLSAAAYAAEIARAGFESVHRNQLDAAEAMNFARGQRLFRVIVPQSWKVIVPPLFSYAIGFIKSTSIASQIGVLELTYAAKVMNTKGFSAVLCFGTILVLYFLVCYPTNLAGIWVEKRLAASRRRPA
jgi:polar amino acid transport system permease protein